jgi:DNA-binding transcriptional ArsR family regulator
VADQGEDQVDDQVQLSDARAIRALAHPARLTVVNALYDQGRQLTATQAAAIAGITPSAMSYHLRALERAGIIKRAEGGADAREHPWVRAANSLNIRPSGPRTTSATTAAKAVVALDAQRGIDLLLAAMDHIDQADEQHPLAGFVNYSHTSLRVTREEARAFFESLTKLVEPWRAETRQDIPEGAGYVSLTFVAYPEENTNSDLAVT